MSNPAPASPDPNNRRISALPKIIAISLLATFALVTTYTLATMNAPEKTIINKEENLQEKNAIQTNDVNEILQYANKTNTNTNTPVQTNDESSASTSSQDIIPITRDNIEQRPKQLNNIDTANIDSTMQVDPRYDEYNQIRKERFKQAISSPIKGYQASAERRSITSDSAIQPPSNSASYQEKMAYYNRRQAELRSNSNPNDQYQQKIALAKQMLGQLNGDNSNSATSDISVTSASGQQAQQQNGRDWNLGNSMEAAKQLTINTGFVIPAVMITGINSDLAGSIIGQVSQNVFDTATGRHLLIPQGTKLFGTYASQIQYGQERVLVAWNRLIFPDGRTLDIGQMLGADVGGYSGFTDQVNNHYWKLFKSAFLLSMVTASVTYADNKYNTGNGDTRDATSALSESLGKELGDVTTELIRKNMNISPTLEIRQGYRFNVIVTKDITFTKPYKIWDR